MLRRTFQIAAVKEFPKVSKIWLWESNIIRSCMATHMYGHTYSKSMDQPGKIANPARGQMNRETEYFLSAFAAENLVSRDGFGSPVPRQPAHLHPQVEYGAYLRESSRVPRRRPFIHL